MKKLLYILLCVAMTLVLFACAANEDIAENSSSEAEQTVEPSPTPEPQAGERYDYHRERITCIVDEMQKDTKDTWKVKSPTESPDPSWVIESIDGDVVTYSKTYCDHVKIVKEIVPCPINSEETHKQLYYVMLEEKANQEGFWSDCEVISNVDGIVTFRKSVECVTFSHKIKYINKSDKVPCQLCPEFNYNGETTYIYDTKRYIMMHTSLEDREKPHKEYTYEYTEGDWEVYSYIECNDIHAVYAARAAKAENAEE